MIPDIVAMDLPADSDLEDSRCLCSDDSNHDTMDGSKVQANRGIAQ